MSEETKNLFSIKFEVTQNQKNEVNFKIKGHIPLNIISVVSAIAGLASQTLFKPENSLDPTLLKNIAQNPKPKKTPEAEKESNKKKEEP